MQRALTLLGSVFGDPGVPGAPRRSTRCAPSGARLRPDERDALTPLARLAAERVRRGGRRGRPRRRERRRRRRRGSTTSPGSEPSADELEDGAAAFDAGAYGEPVETGAGVRGAGAIARAARPPRRCSSPRAATARPRRRPRPAGGDRARPPRPPARRRALGREPRRPARPARPRPPSAPASARPCRPRSTAATRSS